MKKLRNRRAQRGAIFVEAIVVISVFTLCFLGVLYFRELYVRKMQVERLARSSAMAHAMSACTADARAGLEQDLPRDPVQSKKQGSGRSFKVEAPGSGDGVELANKVINEVIGSLSPDNVTAVSLVTTASATTQKDPLSPREGFESEVSSESFVSCMDPVSDEQYGQIVPRVLGIVGSIFDL